VTGGLRCQDGKQYNQIRLSMLNRQQRFAILRPTEVSSRPESDS
jgi:hypothetical protein